MKKALFIFIGASLAIIFFMGMLPSKKSSQKTASKPTASVSSQKEAVPKEIQITGTEYAFSPNTITINRGDKVILTLRNMGTMPHNLAIEDMQVVTKTIQNGQSDQIEFIASQSGSFVYYSGVGIDRTRGMEGNLEVK